jgi:NAD-dependent SIR2 family protein deacetylase
MEDRPEAGWGYQASRMKWYRETPAHAGYTHLLNLSNNQFAQRYFVFTSNVDGQHEKAGFDATKIYTRQGQYKYLQCPLFVSHFSVFPSVNLSTKNLQWFF